jgi:hypothetical protein
MTTECMGCMYAATYYILPGSTRSSCLLHLFTVLASPRTNSPLVLSPPSHRTAPGLPSGSFALCDAYDCAWNRPRHAKGRGQEREQWYRLRLHYTINVAAKGCRPCYDKPWSLRCYSLPQSKIRLVVIVGIVLLHLLHHHNRNRFTSTASPPPPPPTTHLPSPVANTTDTNHPFYISIYAISIASTLLQHSPLFIPSSSPFSPHFLPYHPQAKHSHIRNHD